MLWRKTMAKRLVGTAARVREALMQRRHDPVPQLDKWLGQVVQGYFNYHAVPGNVRSLESFRRGNLSCVARRPPALESEEHHELATVQRPHQTMDSPAQDHAPISLGTLRGQVPAVRAVCGNAARTDLCGGRPEMAVPTAISATSHSNTSNAPFKGVKATNHEAGVRVPDIVARPGHISA
jgi:RNA-directed DNA polymerase